MICRILIFLLLAFAGCATPRGYVLVPAVPAWRFAAESKVLDVPQTLALVGARAAVPIPAIDITDDSFITVDHAWVESLVDWSWSFAQATNLRWVANGFDCDKFALGLALAANFSAQHEGVKHQPLVFRIFVDQIYAFGGVPAGGGHALDACVTERGLYIIEPQTRKLVPIQEYPNRAQIFRVRIGG